MIENNVFEDIKSRFPEVYKDSIRSDIPKGWMEIAEFASSRFRLLGATVIQIKEKFGSMCIILNQLARPDAIAICAEAANWSTHVCQFTGGPGRLFVINGLYVTASDEVARELSKERGDWLALAPLRRAFYPGSFDPITIGHLDVIAQSMKIFDLIIIGVGVNPKKTPTFDRHIRQRMIEASVSRSVNGGGKFAVVTYDGLTVDAAVKNDCSIIVRGIRAMSDFEQELSIAQANNSIRPQISTVLVPTRPEHSFISSTLAREAMLAGNITLLHKWMPPQAVEILKEQTERDATANDDRPNP